MRKRPKLLEVPIPCVVFMDDMEGNRQAFHAAFRRDFNVLLAHSQASLWALLSRHEVHVVIADQRMPGATGCEILAAVRGKYPRIRRMLVTAYTDMRAVVEAMNRSGASYYIQKPWKENEVKAAIIQATDDFQEQAEQDAWTERLAESTRQLGTALRARSMS